MSDKPITKSELSMILDARIRPLEDQVAKNYEIICGLEARMDSLERRMDLLEVGMGALEEKMTRGFAAIMDKMDEIIVKLDHVTSDFGERIKRLESVYL